MVKISEISKYSELYEGVLESFKTAVQELAQGEDKVVDDIIEGEEDLGEKKSVLMVVPGIDRIEHSGTRNLKHNIELYACYLSRDIVEPGTLKRLRNIAGHGYSLVMNDITLDNTVEACIPRSVNPGFIRYGESLYVGVVQTWTIIKREGFTIPGE